MLVVGASAGIGRAVALRAGRESAAIDVAVFAASMARLRPLKNMTPDEWALTLNTNLVGVNLTISALLPHLANGALVAAMSSESAGRPFYALGSYAASKSAMEDTMRAWRVEHPDARFITLVVGSTIPTDFASNFDPEEMVAAFPIWAAQGNAPAEFMQCDEVADVTVGILGSLLPNRTVGIETVFLRSPSPLTGNADSMNAAATENLQT